MRLYFFPAFVPLASMIPGILATVGAVGALVQKVRRKPRGSFLFLGIAVAGIFWGASVFHFRQLALARLPRPGKIELLPPVSGKGAWNQPLPRAPLSDLSYSESHGLVLYGTRQNSLDALRAADGTLAFSVQLASPSLTPPMIVGDRVFVGEGLHEDTSSRLIAISLPDGRAIWEHLFAGHVEAAPRFAPDHQTLWGCAGATGVYALNARNGILRWEAPIGHCDTTPWFENGLVYALVEQGFRRSALAALDATSGAVLWKVFVEGQPWGTPTRDPITGFLIFGSGVGQLGPEITVGETGWLHALDPVRRVVVWTKPLGGMPLLSSLVLKDGGNSVIVQAIKAGELSAFAGDTGAIRWTLKLGAPILSNPTRIPGISRIAVLSFDGTLLEVELASGRIVSRRQLSDQSFSAAAYSKDRAFFASRGGIWSVPLTVDGLEARQ